MMDGGPRYKTMDTFGEEDDVLDIVRRFRKLISTSYEFVDQECDEKDNHHHHHHHYRHQQVIQDIRISLSELLTLNSKLIRVLKSTHVYNSASSSSSPQSSSSSSSSSIFLEQLQSSAWENCCEVLRRRIIQVITECLSNNEVTCYSQLSGPEAKLFVDSIKRFLSKNRRGDGDDDDDDDEECRIIVKRLEGQNYEGNKNVPFITDTPCIRLLRIYSDFIIYRDLVDATDARRFDNHCIVGAVASHLKEFRFRSTAYIERLSCDPCVKTICKKYPGRGVITLTEKNCKQIIMSTNPNLNKSSIDSDSDSPRIQMCLNKQNSIISFSKSRSMSLENDVKRQTDSRDILEEGKEASTSDDRQMSEGADVDVPSEDEVMSRSKGATNFVVLSLLDGESGRIIPLQDAIDRHIVDHKNSTYKDVSTGSLISLAEAAVQGKAFVRPLENTRISFPNRVVDNIVAEMKRSPRVVCRLPAIEDSAVDPEPPTIELVPQPLKDLHQIIDPSKLSTQSFDFLETSFPPRGGANNSNGLSVRQALSKGILAFDGLTFCGEGGKVEVKSLQEAATSGVVEMNVYEGLLRIAGEHSLDNFIKSNSTKTLNNNSNKNYNNNNINNSNHSNGKLKTTSISANLDKVSKRTPQKVDQTRSVLDDCTPDLLSRLDANTTFVTDLTNKNEVISLTGWLKKSHKTSPVVQKLIKKSENITPLKRISNIPINSKMNPKVEQKNDSKKTFACTPQQSNRPQINTPCSDDTTDRKQHLEPSDLLRLKNALMLNKLSAKVFVDENVERTKALKFLKGREIDIDKDLLMTKSRVMNGIDPIGLTKLPKHKNSKSNLKNIIASPISTDKPKHVNGSPKSVSIKDAILTGKLDLNTGMLTSGDSDISIFELGRTNDDVNKQVVGEILSAVTSNSIGRLLVLDNILPNFDPKNLRDLSPISFERSIKEGLIDPTTMFYFNSNTGTLQSLKAAVNSGSFDLKSACFVDETGGKVDIGDALDKGMIKINFTPADVQAWSNEHKGVNNKEICINGDVDDDQRTHSNKMQELKRKCSEELNMVEKKLKNHEVNFDAILIEDQLKSIADNLIMLANSKPNTKKDVINKKTNFDRNQKRDDDDYDDVDGNVKQFKERLHKAWKEFGKIKANLKNKETSSEAWCIEAERRLEIMTSYLSLDVDKLSSQIDDISNVKEEFDKKILCVIEPDLQEKFAKLGKKIDSKIFQSKNLKDCLSSINESMDTIDKWILEAGIELRNLFNNKNNSLNYQFIVTDKLEELHKTLRSYRPTMNEIRRIINELVACSKNKKHASMKTKDEISDNAPEAEGMFPRDRLRKLLTDDGGMKVMNEGSISTAFVDVHASYHDFEDGLIEKAAHFAQSHFGNMSEYLEKIENDIKEVFFASLDAEVLSQQLGDAKSSHEELFSKFSSVQEIAEKLGPIIQSPIDDDLDQASDRMNDVCSKFQAVMDLSDAKVEKLEEAVSLAVQLKEMQAEVENALLDVESLVEFVEIPTNGNPEEIKNELESSKLAREALLEQQVFVDALVNKSHDLLELLSLEKCQERLDQPFIEVRMKFDRLNEQLNDKTNGIIQAWRESTTSLADASESFLEELYKISDAIHLSDPIAPDVETIRRQINETKALTENLIACSRSMEHLKKMLMQLNGTSMPQERNNEDQQIICDDIANQLNDLELMHNMAASNVQIRAAKLKEALSAAEKYEANFSQTKQKLNSLIQSVDFSLNIKLESSEEEDDDDDGGDDKGRHLSNGNILGEDDQVKDHIRNLTKELSSCEREVGECEGLGSELKRLCEDGAEYKVSRDCASLKEMIEELKEAIQLKKEEFDLGEDLSLKFEDLHRNLLSWMQETEEKLVRLMSSGVASEMRAIKIQIEELKVFMRQLYPHLPDLENINHLAELIAGKTSHTSFINRVHTLNISWNKILQATNDREVALSEALVEIGELDQTMDEIIGHLQQVEADIQMLDEACGDPKYIEAHLKNIEMLLDNVDNQLPSIKKLNERINTTLLKSCPTTDSTPSSTPSSREGTQLLPPSKLSSKLQELNESYELVHCLARQKKNYLFDCLKEVKDFMKSVDDSSLWLTKYCKQLRGIQLPGALPTTVQNEYHKFMKHYQELERKLDESRMLLFNGEEMKLRCREDQAVDLQLGLVKLEAQACDAVIKSKIEKERLEDHMRKVQVFHAAMNHHDNWMGGAEKELGTKFKTPSKLLKTVVEQMSEHKGFKEEVSQSQDRVHNLDLTGTYLKYFGSKKDASHVKMQLFGSKSRWKRLVMRTEERGRNLQRAYREDHRFFLSWKELNVWLSDIVTKVQEMDSIHVDQMSASSDLIKKIQLEFPTKQCLLHSTLRQGRHLRDRCTPLDPERKVLEEMIEGIKEKWREACRAINHCERRQCERLVESRQVNEACRSIEEVMIKFVNELKQDVNVRGDLHTVRTIKEQHISLHEKIESKNEDIERLTLLNIIDDVIKSRLQELGGQAEKLWHEKMLLIDEALSLAQNFNDSMMTCHDKLSQTEQEINEIPMNIHACFTREEKFEVTLEKLKRIEIEVKETEDSFRGIDVLFQEIVRKTQPSSVGSLNYCKSLVEAQLHKLKKSVSHRMRTFEYGLSKTRKDREVLDELLAWISNELALLALKENNSVPEDLSTADALFKEHLDFHNELTEKKKTVERFLSPCHAKKTQMPQHGKPNSVGSNPKLVNLNNKWKLIWKVSHDRKKKLQEVFSKLLELRASSHFNFVKWSSRFSSWVSTKKIDLADLFQLTNHKRDGSLGRKEFIDGLVMLRFQCKPGDMNAAFDELDNNKMGRITYKEFIKRLNLEPKRSRNNPVTDAEQIHQNIEEQLTHCKCHQRYLVNKVSDGKYRFGDKGKMCLVRFLNSMVMVRVGGGWVTLPKYLESNDPCRTRGRSSNDWREKFVLADGVSQARVGFQAKRKSSLASTKHGVESSQQLQSPSSSETSRSPYCSSRYRNDNSGSSTPVGRKTPTSSSVRSRTPDFLANSSPTSSIHSLSLKLHKVTPVGGADSKISKFSKIPLSNKSTVHNGSKLPPGASRASVGGTSSDGGSPVPKRNTDIKTSKS